MNPWVLIHIVVKTVGYSDDAIRAKKRRGIWIKGIHWIKAPDGRLLFNLEAIQEWCKGKVQA